MMDKKQRAKLILIQVAAVQEGQFDGRTQDLLTLMNEIVRDSTILSQEILELQEMEVKVAA